MRLWKAILKRSALAVVAGAIALSWNQTGYTQGACNVSRGQDPLDVLNTGVRHNVWVVLDHSGSMDEFIPDTSTRKMEVARDTLIEVIDEFVDGAGNPRVNWGYVRFGSNGVNNTTACFEGAQFRTGDNNNGNRCNGLLLSGLITPPPCGSNDSSEVRNAIAALTPTSGNGSTPNGISMDQISQEIVNRGFVTNLLANQKNYIILVTDGDDTCECGLQDSTDIPGSLLDGVWTPTSVPPFASSEPIPRSLRGGTVSPDFTDDVGTSDADQENIRAINAGTKGRLAYERLNPTAADRTTGAKGGAFVIGLGLGGDSPKRAHHMAWEANGAFYGNPNAKQGALLANDKSQLKQALFDAFAQIGVPSSTVSLASPIIGTVREVIPSFTNPAVTVGDHVGSVGPANVDPEDVREARQVRLDHQENVIFTSLAEIPGFRGRLVAQSLYRVTDPANPRLAREADLVNGQFRKIWDAGERLRDTHPDSRNILFNRAGQTLLPFDTDNVLPSDLGPKATTGFLRAIDGTGALTPEDARDMIVGVIRGYRLSTHPDTGTLYDTNGDINFSEFEQDGVTPRWKLFEAIAAPAVVQSPPRSPDFDPPQNHASEYGVGGIQVGDGFYWDHFNRQTMVYLPTNGGMMHGFDAGTGDEVFAYIPDDAMNANGEVAGSRDTLADFVELVVGGNNGIQNHKFFLSGTPTVKDTFLRSDFGGDDRWHTLLAFGRGRGGRFLTALDVTDPLQPRLRFNIGNREGINDGLLDGLGETWSLPVMGNVAVQNPTGSPHRVDQWLVFFGGGYGCDNSAQEGQHIFAVRAEDGSLYHRNTVTNNPSAAVPYNALVAMPVLYNPHQVDVADSNDFTTRLYIGDVQGNIWKLSMAALDPATWVFGKFAELGTDQPISAPLAVMKDPNNQQVYVMGGTGGDLRVPGTNEFKFVTLIDRDVDSANTTQYPLGTAPFWERILSPQERVYIAPALLGRLGDPLNPAVVLFAASTPDFDLATCTGRFFSTFWALGILSGQAEFDLDGQGGVDTHVDVVGKIIGIEVSGDEVFALSAGGLGSDQDLQHFGDGTFEDDIPLGGGPGLQVLVDGFRISPF